MTPAPRAWALVTGASSGIGMALARELARRGHHLLLLGREKERLAQLAEELAREHGAAVRILARDLGDPAALGEVRALAREEYPLGVLVNNAGYGVHGRFTETDLEREVALVQLQIQAMLALTKACLPGMLRRGEGKILTVASIYAYSPVPWQAVYAACKAFLLSFSQSLAAELQGTGVSVTVLCPGLTTTPFRTRAGMPDEASWMAMDAQTVASMACRGLFRKKAVVVPGVMNRLYVLASSLVPGRISAWVTAQVNRRRGLGARHDEVVGMGRR